MIRLAQIVVDAEDVGFVENTKQNSIELLGRCEIMPEWLFHHDARASAAIRFRQVLDHGFFQVLSTSCDGAARPLRQRDAAAGNQVDGDFTTAKVSVCESLATPFSSR